MRSRNGRRRQQSRSSVFSTGDWLKKLQSTSLINLFYFSKVGFIYVFNLMVGTGALTLPAAFSGAGWLISLIIILFLAFVRLYFITYVFFINWYLQFWIFSFVTLTFVVETMGAANAILRNKRFQRAQKKDTDLLEQNSTDEARICDDHSDISSPSSPTRSLVKYFWFPYKDFCFLAA